MRSPDCRCRQLLGVLLGLMYVLHYFTGLTVCFRPSAYHHAGYLVSFSVVFVSERLRRIQYISIRIPVQNSLTQLCVSHNRGTFAWKNGALGISRCPERQGIKAGPTREEYPPQNVYSNNWFVLWHKDIFGADHTPFQSTDCD